MTWNRASWPPTAPATSRFPSPLRHSRSFRPDGSKLAFVGYVPPGYPQIYVKDLASGEVTQLTHGTGAYDPDWSPDGTKIAFTQGPGGYGAPEIYVMSSDGSDEVRLTFELDGGAWAFDPSWSPDGAKIAFTHTYQGQQYEIYTMNADGSGLVNLTDNYVGPPDYTRIDDETAAWSPDGRQIAFVRRVGNPLQLMVMNADGGQPSALPAEGAAPVWQALPAPRRSDFKNASSFCKVEREFWGEQAFRQRYGNGRNAHGKCVSQG